MTRARIVIIVRSICCAKIKGVDQDGLESDSGGSEAERVDSSTDSSEGT